MSVTDLLELDRIAKSDVERFRRTRFVFDAVANEPGKHFIGLVGPRGVGKTVLLKQLASKIDNSFYVAADTLGDADLFETIKTLSEDYNAGTILLDEIHFKRDYHEALKKMFDFLHVRVIFTSSVSLSLFSTAYDLSRRIRLLHMFPFSFREYINFKTGDSLPPLSLNNVIAGDFDRGYMRYEYLFEKYLKGGCMPFSLEEPQVLLLLQNVVETIITRDIPAVERLAVDELPLIRKVLSFAGRSKVEGINYTSIARNVGITKYKSEQYVSLLTRAFLLNPVFPTGTNVLREPKVLFCLPYRLLYEDYENAIGAVREDFVTESFRMAGMEYSYLKSTRGRKTPDYAVMLDGDELVVEVGGKGKGREQFKGFEKKKSLILSHTSETTGIKRPLFLAGFLG